VTARKAKALECTAYHEAGHAVMYFFQEIPFRRVMIIPSGDTLGSLHHYRLGRKPKERVEIGFHTPRDRDRLEREIMCLLAGHAAERHFAGRANHRGSHSDHKTAVDLAFPTMHPKEVQAYLRWLSIRAIRSFLTANQYGGQRFKPSLLLYWSVRH
jgi:ATP-dependent Zn protease